MNIDKKKIKDILVNCQHCKFVKVKDDPDCYWNFIFYCGKDNKFEWNGQFCKDYKVLHKKKECWMCDLIRKEIKL